MTGDAGGPVLVVGDVVSDVVVLLSGDLAPGSDTPAQITITGGGSAANTAVWLARLGVPVTAVAVVGDDPAGQARLAELAAEGVRLSVRRDPSTGTGTVVVLASVHERTMINDRGANARLVPGDIDAALEATPSVRHLHLSGYPLLDASSRPAARHALAAAAGRGMTASVGAGSAAPLRRVGGAIFLSWVRGADLLIANLDEAAALLGEPAGPRGNHAGGPAERAGSAAVRLAGATGGAAVVTCGAYGSAWADPDGRTARVPAVPATVVDPTGAGDAFTAGLLARWLAAGGPDEALLAGTRLAATAINKAGGRPA